jgi:hypothetical protein
VFSGTQTASPGASVSGTELCNRDLRILLLRPAHARARRKVLPIGSGYPEMDPGGSGG